MLKKNIRAGVMLYALLMAAVFSLLLQFYLNRQTAHQRNLLAQQERQEAYAIALLTKDQKLADSGQFSFNKGQSHYRQEKDQLIVNVVISDRTYDFTFAIKEPSVRLDKDRDKDKKSETGKRRKERSRACP
ncbi:competence type IV pilus minor pilin ComGG [Streptococcus gordonii]|uniref:competence type IV pilus minor pilin ComGG n=1 Tax=Streptococcus gordonii TaxID=1302 RepID=UPI000AF8568C|nr:competence type IV pilus minor pilin ComGG [Streptococcus gordonii]